MTQIEYKYNVAALRKLKETHAQGKLTRQQYRTLCGQVMAGNPDAAMRGLRKILLRSSRVFHEKMNVSQETANRRETNEQTT